MIILFKYAAMRMDYENLDFEILERLYTAKSKELEQDLLTGVSWEEVRIKRLQLTELSSAMNRKLHDGHPLGETSSGSSDDD